jgi:NAD(P)-dependent dehydrogenase (short-subunit alcohol dehydrogenase family)
VLFNLKQLKVLITGANSGMGKEIALAMAKQNYHVIMLCRDEKRGREAQQDVMKQSGKEDIDLLICDLGSIESIKKFYATFCQKYDELHILINNAGVALPGHHETVDGFELQFGVNYLGHFALTGLLLPQLRKGSPARVINVSSGAHKTGKIHFDDLQQTKSYKSINSYAQSKLAIVLFTRSLSEKLKKDDITVNSLNPGLTGTQMGVDRETGSGKFLARIVKLFFLTPEKGAATTIYLATSQEIANVTGEYFFKKKIAKISKLAQNKEVAKRLWDVSVNLTGIEPKC